MGDAEPAIDCESHCAARVFALAGVGVDRAVSAPGSILQLSATAAMAAKRCESYGMPTTACGVTDSTIAVTNCNPLRLTVWAGCGEAERVREDIFRN